MIKPQGLITCHVLKQLPHKAIVKLTKPILLSILAKLFEKQTLLERLKSTTDSPELIQSHQFGFRKKPDLVRGSPDIWHYGRVRLDRYFRIKLEEAHTELKEIKGGVYSNLFQNFIVMLSLIKIAHWYKTSL